MRAVRIRIAAMLVLLAATVALATPVAAQASGYCGTVRGYKVFTSGVTCATARYYIARNACPRGWARYRVYQQFGFEVVGYGCRSGGRRFKGQR
jgi:hypothetical protein